MYVTFLLVCFLSLKRSLVKLRKMFSFHFKSSFRSLGNQILEFSIFKFHDAIKFLSINKDISLNNLESKYILLMKFDQFTSYYKRIFIKKFYKNCDLKTSSRPFCVCKELSTTSIGKWNFWSKLLILDK